MKNLIYNFKNELLIIEEIVYDLYKINHYIVLLYYKKFNKEFQIN